jgi:hypothetical protein
MNLLQGECVLLLAQIHTFEVECEAAGEPRFLYSGLHSAQRLDATIQSYASTLQCFVVMLRILTAHELHADSKGCFPLKRILHVDCHCFGLEKYSIDI